MLKQELKIFENLNTWNKNKYRTLFKNKFELENYQNYFLEKLLKNKQEYEPTILTSSGTTNNNPKRYRFPRVLYPIIETQHIWKIMQSHRIEPGNAVAIFQTLIPSVANSYSRHDPFTNKLRGPSKKPFLGLMNNTWELYFNPLEIDKNFWKQIFIDVKKIKPKFLYTSPSVFESFYKEANENFDFPVVFSLENLTDVVRKKSELVFSKSIDKMRDWTTGFGFFECSCNTRHIYDELCLAKQSQEDKIISTDFFNYCELFIDKISDDSGVIKQKLCDCGIYGNYLEEFKGKIGQCLVSMKGKKYSAHFMKNLFALLPFELDQYEIIQTKNKNIEFKTKNTINDFQANKIATLLNELIGDLDENFSFSILNNNKILYLSPNTNLYIKFIVENPKIYKNKVISIRSYAV